MGARRVTLPPAARPNVGRVLRILRTALSALAALSVLVASIALYAFVQGDPSIARARGLVASIRPVDDGRTEVCIRDTTDAGSSGGALEDRELVCWDGALEGVGAAVGECVVLQTEGETDYLRVEKADGC